MCPLAVSSDADRFVRVFLVSQTKTSIAETLAQAGLFTGLSETELHFLGQHAVPGKFSSGAIVFSEGDACASLGTDTVTKVIGSISQIP